MAGTDLDVLFDLLREAESPGLDTTKPGAKELIAANLVDADGRITEEGRKLLSLLTQVYQKLGGGKWQGLDLSADAQKPSADPANATVSPGKLPGLDGKV